MGESPTAGLTADGVDASLPEEVVDSVVPSSNGFVADLPEEGVERVASS